MTTETSADETGAGPARRRPLRELGQFVDRRVTALQERYLDRGSVAVATLARLRRGVSKEVGALPELWQVTLEGIPMPFEPYDDTPTYGERAAYTAITLYALHQQSRRDGMHRRGPSLGTAARVLRKRAPSEDAVRRRFEAVGTATTFAEVVHHSRGLITQLRGAGIPLDYGVLADQLFLLQTPGGADQVRLAWGRDFYRVTSDSPNGDPAPAAETALTSEEVS